MTNLPPKNIKLQDFVKYLEEKFPQYFNLIKRYDFLKFKDAIGEYSFDKYYPDRLVTKPSFRISQENALQKYAEIPLETLVQTILDSYKEEQDYLGYELVFRRFGKLLFRRLPTLIIEKRYHNIRKAVYPIILKEEEIFDGEKIKIFFPIQSVFSIYLIKVTNGIIEEVDEISYNLELYGLVFYAELNSAF